MPLYTIVRDLTGFSDGEIDAAAVRAVICAYEYPEMRWVRSYLDRARGEMLCLYSAASPEQLREHARRSRIPAGEIREVEEVVPAQFLPITPPSPETTAPVQPR